MNIKKEGKEVRPETSYMKTEIDRNRNKIRENRKHSVIKEETNEYQQERHFATAQVVTEMKLRNDQKWGCERSGT